MVSSLHPPMCASERRKPPGERKSISVAAHSYNSLDQRASLFRCCVSLALDGASETLIQCNHAMLRAGSFAYKNTTLHARTYMRTNARTHARTHARKHARTHAHTHKYKRTSLRTAAQNSSLSRSPEELLSRTWHFWWRCVVGVEWVALSIGVWMGRWACGLDSCVMQVASVLFVNDGEVFVCVCWEWGECPC